MGLARVGRGAGTGGAGGGGVRGWANAHLARVALGRVVHSLFSPATAHAHMAAIKSDTCVCVYACVCVCVCVCCCIAVRCLPKHSCWEVRSFLLVLPTSKACLRTLKDPLKVGRSRFSFGLVGLVKGVSWV